MNRDARVWLGQGEPPGFPRRTDETASFQLACALLVANLMRSSDRLRYELLAALATGGLLSISCGGKTDSTDFAGGGGSGASTGGVGASGGISSGGTSTGGVSTGGTSTGGTSTGGTGGVSDGGSGGVGGNPVILGTPSCDWSCAAPDWMTCWQAGTVPTAPGDVGTGPCPESYYLDVSAYSPCGADFYNLWYSGPVEVAGMPGYCCYDTGVACPGGRPFRVAGELRVANVERRPGWSNALAEPSALDGATRAALCRAWLLDAQLEHASVAAFARLTLQLMALGAPSDLVEESQAASLDEIEHARMCFGFAGRYGEGPFGPGQLDSTGALEELSLEALLTTSIDEGCIGETLAAMVAAEQAREAEDPEAKRALETIAADETRHAALAWRIVRWVLERQPSLRSTAERAFGAMLARALDAEPQRESSEIDSRAYRAHGRLTAEEVVQAREEAVARVIIPCLESLLGVRSGSRQELATASGRRATIAADPCRS